MGSIHRQVYQETAHLNTLEKFSRFGISALHNNDDDDWTENWRYAVGCGGPFGCHPVGAVGIRQSCRRTFHGRWYECAGR